MCHHPWRYCITENVSTQANPLPHWHGSCMRLPNLKEDYPRVVLQWSWQCLITARAETWPSGTVPTASRAKHLHPWYCLAQAVTPRAVWLKSKGSCTSGPSNKVILSTQIYPSWGYEWPNSYPQMLASKSLNLQTDTQCSSTLGHSRTPPKSSTLKCSRTSQCNSTLKQSITPQHSSNLNLPKNPLQPSTAPSCPTTRSHIPWPQPEPSPRVPYPTTEEMLSHLECLNDHNPLSSFSQMDTYPAYHHSSARHNNANRAFQHSPGSHCDANHWASASPPGIYTSQSTTSSTNANGDSKHPDGDDPRLTNIHCLIPSWNLQVHWHPAPHLRQP